MEGPRVISTRSRGLGVDVSGGVENLLAQPCSSGPEAECLARSSGQVKASKATGANGCHEGGFRIPTRPNVRSGATVVEGRPGTTLRAPISRPLPKHPSAVSQVQTRSCWPSGSLEQQQTYGFRPFKSKEVMKEEDQVAAAVEALTSLSSNATESTHLTAPSPLPGQSQNPGSKAEQADDKDLSPDLDLTHLQPTPSPYQDSNADPEAQKFWKGQSFAQTAKSSIYKGVSWHKHSQKWYAYIQHTGKMHGLGYFRDEQKAAEAYDAEAKKVHGAKAVLNFPYSNGFAPSAQGERGQLSRANSMQPSSSIGFDPWRSEHIGQNAHLQRNSVSLESLFENQQGVRDAPFGSHRELVNLERSHSVKSPDPEQKKRPNQEVETVHLRRSSRSTKLTAHTEELGNTSDSGNSSNGIVGASWNQDDGQSLEAYDIGRKDRDQFNEVLEPLSPRNMQKGHAKPTSHVPRRRQKPPKASFPSQTWSNKHQHRGSSKFKGVSWSERSGKWRAQMWYGNKVNHLGFYDNEEDAARCYDAAVMELRGPMAPTNFDPRQAVGHGILREALIETMTKSTLPKVTSQYRGVRWHYPTSKWEARIFDGSRQRSLGSSHSEEEAAKLYDEEARRLRGSAAVVNFSQEGQRETTCALRGRENLQTHIDTSTEGGQAVSPLLAKWGSKKRRVGA